MSAPEIPERARGAAPRGQYAGGHRSPIVHVRLCGTCAGYHPFTPRDYDGALSGQCQGCGSWVRETHRFIAFLHTASGCTCGTHSEAIVGDLHHAPAASLDPEGTPHA